MKIETYLSEKGFDVYGYHEKYTQDWSKLSTEECLWALEQEENVNTFFIHDGKTLVFSRFDIILSIQLDAVDKAILIQVRNVYRASANKKQEQFQAKLREING
jgi:hypothetical protein